MSDYCHQCETRLIYPYLEMTTVHLRKKIKFIHFTQPLTVRYCNLGCFFKHYNEEKGE